MLNSARQEYLTNKSKHRFGIAKISSNPDMM